MDAHTPDQIRAARLLAMRGALKLQAVGLHRSRGPSALQLVRAETGLQARTARDMVPRFDQWLRARGILRD